MDQQATNQTKEEAFETALGLARDRLASLRNLEQLLKSRNIGPKAIKEVVNGIRRGSQPPGDALAALIEMVGSRSLSIDVSGLLAFARERALFLDDAMDEAAKSKMGAAARLRLESKTVQLVADMEALRDLIGLLDSATTTAATELRLNALAVEALKQCPPTLPKRSSIVNVSVMSAKEDATVVADARSIVPLMATAFGLIASERTKSLRVETSLGADGEAILACEPSPDGSLPGVQCSLPRVIAPSLSAVRSAASLTGVSFSYDERASRVGLIIPPSPASVPVIRPPCTSGDQ